MSLKGMHVTCYPEAAPANKLATQRAKAIKAKVKAPFPLIDIAEFLPTAFEASSLYLCMGMSVYMLPVKLWQDTNVAEDETGEAESVRAPTSKSRKRLDMVRWVAAFQAYALAAEAAEVWQ